MATLIKSDGTQTVVHPKGGIGRPFALAELQDYVGGYIEMIFASGKTVVVNEEGCLKGLPCNDRASLVAGLCLVGDVLICGKGEIE